MPEISDDEIIDELLTLAIENALLDMGKPIIKVVEVRLREKFDLELSSAFNHPNELSQILNELFGDAYKTLMQKIENNLKKSNQNNKIDEFLEAMIIEK